MSVPECHPPENEKPKQATEVRKVWNVAHSELRLNHSRDHFRKTLGGCNVEQCNGEQGKDKVKVPVSRGPLRLHNTAAVRDSDRAGWQVLRRPCG